MSKGVQVLEGGGVPQVFGVITIGCIDFKEDHVAKKLIIEATRDQLVKWSTDYQDVEQVLLFQEMVMIETLRIRTQRGTSYGFDHFYMTRTFGTILDEERRQIEISYHDYGLNGEDPDDE